MEYPEKRRAPRFVQFLPAVLTTREGGDAQAEVYSLSRHGLFVRTATQAPPGILAQLHLALPGEAGERRTPIRMITAVAWCLGLEEAARRGCRPGLGLQIYMVGARDKALWDRLVDDLEAAGQEPCSRPPPVREGSVSAPGPVRYLLRARSMGALERFAVRELGRNGLFLQTPLLAEIDERVDLILIHPHTHAEFQLPGRVYGQRNQGELRQRGMEIRFVEELSALQERLRHFVFSGNNSYVSEQEELAA